MPTVPFTFLALVWRRERDGPCLAELLFFPEISRVAASPRAAVDALKENLPGLVKQADPARLHACRLPPDLRHEQVEGLDALRWSAPNGIEVHYLPDLRLEIVSQGDSNVEREIAAHLARTGVPGPEALARRRRLEIVRFEMDVEIPTPLERAAAQARDEKPTHDAITDLGLQPPAEAFERDREVLAVVDALEGRASRSVLLVGPPGVGKTAIAREASRHARAPFWETSGPRLVAGMSGFGMWQERCQDLVREARRGGAVLLLGNLVELSQAGRYKGDASGVAAFFRPLLARGDVLAIVEATPTQISLLEREDPRLLEAFQRVDVKEPDPVACRAILRKSSPGLSDEILEVVERLHRRYGSYSAWPGRPLRFVRNLEGLDAVEVFSTETGIPRALLDDRVPFDLEQARATLAESVVGQPEAVDLVVDLIATLKAGLVRPGRPIASLLFVGPTGVGKTQLAK
ncbi:MAG: AAA family ATPase, partial [Armatimonadetes bacterium]|nr:AAA family ATPase [Armatimonadota bacterium]